MSDNLKEWLRDIFFAAVIAAVILLIIMPTVVKESSMENTLVENDYLIVSKIPYTLVGNYKKGDIIVFQSTIPNDGSDRGISILQPKYKLLVKRIVAVGGDTIAISEGNVYVNGEMIQEDYLKDGTTNGSLAETTVPEGYLFCMGDNRLVSRDSRDPSVGFVSEDSVKGRVVFRLFPFDKFGKIK